MASPKEAAVIHNFKKFINELSTKPFFRKIHVSPMHNKGFPDCIVIINGVVLFVEAKRLDLDLGLICSSRIYRHKCYTG